MTFASYMRTNATATVKVAANFRPRERDMAIISASQQKAGQNHYRVSGGFSQRPKLKPEQNCNLLILLALCLIFHVPAVRDHRRQGHPIRDEREDHGPDQGPEAEPPEQGSQGVREM